jgi:hypothetical protein
MSTSLALLISGIACAAFCIWLTVRIVNRRERWAKWMLAVVVGLPTLYAASFGPCVWLADRDIISINLVAKLYAPILPHLEIDGILWSYGNLGCRSDSFTMVELWLIASLKLDGWGTEFPRRIHHW